MARERDHGVVAEEEAAGNWIESIADNIGVTDKTREATPVGQVDFSFRAVKDGFAECYGEADRRIVDLIVIGVVIHVTAENVSVQPELLEEGLGQTDFVIISLRRLNGKLQGDRVQGCGCSGTGEQDVFEGGGLKNAIVREMQDDARRREIARDGQARLERLAVQQKLIVIPSKSGIDRPVAQPDQILNEGGLLEVRAAGLKAKRKRRAVIKLRRIGNVVAEVFVQESVVRFNSKLPFVPPMIDGPGALEITFAKAIVLENFDGGGCRVGVEIIGIIADHAAKVGDRMRRKGVLVGDGAHGLDVIRVLKLARGLL